MGGVEVQAEARLVMNFADERTADRVLKALAPDNEPLPRGLRINARRTGSAVVFEIYSERTVMSLLATIDDIVSMASLAEKAASLAADPDSS